MPLLKYSRWEEACKIRVLEDTTQVEAYRRAFPNAHKMKKKTIAVVSSQFFNRDDVKERLKELEIQKAEVAKKEFDVDAAYVLRRLVEIDRMDIADILEEEGRAIKPVNEWPEVWRQFINAFDVEEIFAGRGDDRLRIGLLRKIKWPDKVRNLEMLGKHVEVNAFKEVQEHTGPGGGPLRMINTKMNAQEAAEAYADTLNDK